MAAPGATAHGNRTMVPARVVPSAEQAEDSLYYQMVRELYKDDALTQQEGLGLAAAAWQEAMHKGPDLTPNGILRTVVYCQAAFRRFLVEDMVQIAGIEAVPPPPVAVGAFFARRMLHPERVDVEGEAMAISCIICGREEGLTLGPLRKAYQEYAAHLPPDHAVLAMLLERFGEVQVDAETDLGERLSSCTLPSEARAAIEECKKHWEAPDIRPDGGPIFEAGYETVRQLRGNAEQMLTARLDKCQTKADIDGLAADVENELQGGHTVLRSRVRAARESHRARLELEVHSVHGWPPTGQVSSLGSAARWYCVELGSGHPAVEDFVAAAQRAKRTAEANCAAELGPIDASLTKLRMQLSTDPPPPKLMAEGLTQQFREEHAKAVVVVEEWWKELESESSSFFTLAEKILGNHGFLERCERELEEQAQELRDLPPGPVGLKSAEAEQRLCASTRALQLMQAMRDFGSWKVPQLEGNFPKPDLERAQPLVHILAPEEGAAEDDGWHRPPGFRDVDAELAPKEPTPPPTPPPKTPEPEPQPADISCSMRLHGVCLDDVAKAKSEVLLMERLRSIVAQECGVPEDWISDIKLKAPEPKAPPAASADGDGSHLDATSLPGRGSKAPSQAFSRAVSGSAEN